MTSKFKTRRQRSGKSKRADAPAINNGSKSAGQHAPAKNAKKLELFLNTANTANVAPTRRTTIKAEQTVALGNGKEVGISGLRDEGGTRYIHVRQANHIVVMPYEDWHGGGAAASAALRAGG